MALNPSDYKDLDPKHPFFAFLKNTPYDTVCNPQPDMVMAVTSKRVALYWRGVNPEARYRKFEALLGASQVPYSRATYHSGPQSCHQIYFLHDLPSLRAIVGFPGVARAGLPALPAPREASTTAPILPGLESELIRMQEDGGRVYEPPSVTEYLARTNAQTEQRSLPIPYVETVIAHADRPTERGGVTIMPTY